MNKLKKSLIVSFIIVFSTASHAMDIQSAVSVYGSGSKESKIHIEAMVRSSVALWILAGAGECFTRPYDQMASTIMGRISNSYRTGRVSGSGPFDLLLQLEVMKICMDNGGQSDPESRKLAKMLMSG